jgi:hypothetical protein
MENMKFFMITLPTNRVKWVFLYVKCMNNSVYALPTHSYKKGSPTRKASFVGR